MKRWVLGLVLALTPLAAQAPPQELAVSATVGARMGLAFPAPQVGGDAALGALVQKDLHAVALRDLDEAGPFAILKGHLQGPTDPASYKGWADAGAEWLLALKVNRLKGDDLELVLQVTDVKAAKSVFSIRYACKEGGLRPMAHTLADEVVYRFTGERGVSSTQILFVRQVEPGVKEIFRVDRDGEHLVQLTHHHSLSLSPTMAPDGRLAYMTYRGGPPEIWGQTRPGGPHQKLYPLGAAPEGQCSAPAWSPDGRRLAFVLSRGGHSDIMLMDLESRRVRRLTDSNCINTEPTWNPRGNQIAFTSDRDGGPQVFLMEDDGSNVRRLTREGGYNASPAWSPSGSMIAYVSRFEGKFDLFVYKLGEGRSYQITTGVASSESPAWSPDERRIVFTSGSAGGMQLFTTDLSGNGLRRLISLSGCQSPRWTNMR